MGFSRQESWSELPCPPPGHLPDPGRESASLKSAALAGGFFTISATWEAQMDTINTTLSAHTYFSQLTGPWYHKPAVFKKIVSWLHTPAGLPCIQNKKLSTYSLERTPLARIPSYRLIPLRRNTLIWPPTSSAITPAWMAALHNKEVWNSNVIIYKWLNNAFHIWWEFSILLQLVVRMPTWPMIWLNYNSFK